MNPMKKYYIGIDPDLRLLSAAIISDTKEAKAVFIRRNKEGKDDTAVANASEKACRLVEDVIAWFVGNYATSVLVGGQFEIVTVVESQSMMHTKRMRDSGRNIDYEKVRLLAQVAGCLMGAVSNLSNRMVLVQPINWKGNVPKPKAHLRYYGHLNILASTERKVQNIYPADMEICSWSKEKINPGDFIDINDSLGLALHGAKKGL